MSIFSDLLKHRYFFIFIALLCGVMLFGAITKHLALLPNNGILQNGDLWRLVSGHLVHASWQHLALNVINLFLLRLVFSQWMSLSTFTIFILINTISISIGLIFSTSLTYYVGFSGVFYALLIYFLLSYWNTQRIIFSIAIVCVVGKIFYEQWIGVSKELVDFIDIAVAIDAHAWGLLSGSMFWLLEKYVFSSFFFKHRHIDTGIK